MEIFTETKEPAIVRGIKDVGVGKKGSKSLSPDLACEIAAELKCGTVSPARKGAFFGALFIKGITPDVMILDSVFEKGTLTNPKRLAEAIAADAPPFVRDICSFLLEGQTLDRESAHRLGKFLFSDDPCDDARGLIASVLRVRYETADEYQGLLMAMEETFAPSFREEIPSGEPIVQLAEPFDGVDNSYLLTPLLANYIQKLGYRVVSLVGRNSGPKNGNTLSDLIEALGIKPILENSALNDQGSPFGHYIHQRNLSQAIDRWVGIRREVIKRPFLSTLEKFLNPAKANILVTSAFHPPYTEKMLTIAERAGFPGVIVMRNGQEGSLSFPLNRSVKILCSAVRCEGDYLRTEMEVKPNELLGFEIKTDEKLIQPSISENAKFILNFKEKNTSGHSLFDARVKVTCEGLRKAIEWVKENTAVI